MRCRQLVKPLSHQGPHSIQTQTSKHLLIKNRDTYEIRMQALRLQYLSLSWNGGFCFKFTNYKSRVKYFFQLTNWNNSPRIYMSLHSDTLWPDSEPTSLCSVSLILRALHYKQQIPVYNLCFDPIGTRFHDLQHSRWAR
jgi:hypothetical protein